MSGSDANIFESPSNEGGCLKQLPMVSVICPAYNMQEYANRAVDSFCKQTYKNTELIVVDDGSTDDTYARMVKYSESDSRIRVLRQSNMGVSNARNAGLGVARGEFITFVDADDYYSEDHIANMVSKALKAHADLVCTAIEHVGLDGERIALLESPPDVEGRHSLRSTSPIQLGVPMYVFNHLFKASVIDGLRFDGSLKLLEDRKYVYEAYSRASVVYVCNEATYKYVYRPESAINSKFSWSDIGAVAVSREIFLNELANQRPHPAYALYSSRAVSCLLRLLKYGYPPSVYLETRGELLKYDYLSDDIADGFRRKYFLVKQIDSEVKYKLASGFLGFLFRRERLDAGQVVRRK